MCTEAWRRYVTSARAYSSGQESETVSYQEKLEDEFRKVVTMYMATHYLVQPCQNLRECSIYADSALQGFADVSPPMSAAQILRLSIYNLAMMGPKMSLSYTEFQSEIRAEITAHPEVACILVLLPNVPAFGSGNCTGIKYVQEVQKNKDKYLALLRELSADNVLALECGGVLNEISLTDRDLRISFVMCFSCTMTVADGKASCPQLFSCSVIEFRVGQFHRAYVTTS